MENSTGKILISQLRNKGYENFLKCMRKQQEKMMIQCKIEIIKFTLVWRTETCGLLVFGCILKIIAAFCRTVGNVIYQPKVNNNSIKRLMNS